jgi:hypothetical protein
MAIAVASYARTIASSCASMAARWLEPHPLDSDAPERAHTQQEESDRDSQDHSDRPALIIASFARNQRERRWMKRLASRLTWWHTLPHKEHIAVNAA